MKKGPSLKGFLISSIAFAVIIPVIIIGLAMIKVSADSLREEITSRNEIVSNTLVMQIEEYLNHPIIDLLMLKDQIEHHKPDNHVLDTWLNYLNESHEYFIKLHIADNKGIVKNVAPYDKEFIDIDVSRQLYFMEPKRKDTNYWSAAFISPQLNIPVVTLSIPFEDGVITGYLSLSKLTQIVKAIKLGTNSYITITDQTATFIVHPDETKVFQRAYDTKYDVFKKEFQGTLITKTVSCEGEKMICNADFIRQTDWALVIHQAVEEVYAPVKHLYYILGMGILFILAIAVLLSARHITLIISTVKQFIDPISDICEGAYDKRIEEVEYDEFSKLAEHFNRMAESVKQREDALIESEERFRQAVENIEDVFLIGSVDWNEIFYISPAYEKIWARSCNSLYKEPRSWLDSVVDEDRESVITYINNAVFGEFSEVVLPEFRIFKSDGSVRWISFRVFPIRNEHREIYRIAGIAEDVTIRKKAEEERIRLATAIDQAEETVVITDTEGTILYANPAFEKTSGYTCEEAVGLNPRILQSGRHDQVFYQKLWDTITQGRVWTGHFINKRKDGTLYQEESTISPVKNSSGQIVNFVAVKRDVTREIQLEQQLRQAQKMESIGTLSGGIAHDFNNILFSIIGNAEIALSDLPEQHPAEYSIDQILQAGYRAKDLVKQILTFSRQTEYELKPVRVSHLVKETLKLLRPSLPSTIEIRTKFNASRDVILGDPSQIHQVLMNLCTNALHAMYADEGILEISLSNVEFDDETATEYESIELGPHLKLIVSDTGHGMSLEVMERIFDPYFTTKGRGEGTGMGLSVVHGIVQSHGGSITVHSEPDEGATFQVFFPLIENDIEHGYVTLQSISRGNERILFVDDKKELVDLAKRMLKGLGYDVEAKTSSIEALEAFRSQPENYDLIITDLTMPNMTGEKLAKELLRIRPDIPIILCTGYSEKVSEERIRDLGIKAFVMKPIVRAKLAEIIRKVLDA